MKYCSSLSKVDLIGFSKCADRNSFRSDAEKIHPSRKLAGSIPRSGFASSRESIESSFGFRGVEHRVPWLAKMPLLAARSSCLVLFPISVRSLKRSRSIDETALPAFYEFDVARHLQGNFCILHFVAKALRRNVSQAFLKIHPFFPIFYILSSRFIDATQRTIFSPFLKHVAITKRDFHLRSYSLLLRNYLLYFSLVRNTWIFKAY